MHILAHAYKLQPLSDAMGDQSLFCSSCACHAEPAAAVDGHPQEETDAVPPSHPAPAESVRLVRKEVRAVAPLDFSNT